VSREIVLLVEYCILPNIAAQAGLNGKVHCHGEFAIHSLFYSWL